MDSALQPANLLPQPTPTPEGGGSQAGATVTCLPQCPPHSWQGREKDTEDEGDEGHGGEDATQVSRPVMPAGFGHAVGEDGLQEDEQHAGGEGHPRSDVVQHLGVVHLQAQAVSSRLRGATTGAASATPALPSAAESSRQVLKCLLSEISAKPKPAASSGPEMMSVQIKHAGEVRCLAGWRRARNDTTTPNPATT